MGRPDDRTRRFEQLALPHLDAAYSLARWLTGRPEDAKDVAQEALLRAFRYFDGFEGSEFRPWLLSIVRRTSYTWLARNRGGPVDWDVEGEVAAETAPPDPSPTPEMAALSSADRALLNRLIAELPLPFREILLLREVQDLSYREIADVVGAPVGTVMSRLSRARDLLRRAWSAATQEAGDD